MARNRKHQSAVIRFGPALKAFLLCLMIGGAGVGYVWQKNQIYQLGQQIRKRELRLADLEEQNEKLKKQLAVMRSPQFLETRIKELNLGLTVPEPSQVWRLPEPPPETARPDNERQFVQQTAAATGP
jgi:cell division protein FtsL